MIIIGITGAIEHGKTSLAQAFLRQINPSIHTESSILIAEVANELNSHYLITRPKAFDQLSINAWLTDLPNIIRKTTGFNSDISAIRLNSKNSNNPDFDKLHEYLKLVSNNHSLITQPITPTNKEQYRTILQWLGSYVTKYVSSSLWYDNIIQQAKIAQDNGYKLFIVGGVRYPSDAQVIKQAGGIIIAIERPNIEHRDLNDPSEAFRSMVPADTTVMNDFSLGALDSIAQKIWNDILDDDLQKQYHASQTSTDYTAQSVIDLPERSVL
ncbi:hypothetical protein KDA11_02765 [Candidatus Saccharibacteria bacterium]|nr:hypothetical protein [Candidatus Saccharibacteria bacterium]